MSKSSQNKGSLYSLEVCRVTELDSMMFPGRGVDGWMAQISGNERGLLQIRRHCYNPDRSIDPTLDCWELPFANHAA